MELGSVLDRLLKREGLTLKEGARLIKAQPGTLYRIRDGSRSGLPTLLKLAAKLGYDLRVSLVKRDPLREQKRLLRP